MKTKFLTYFFGFFSLVFLLLALSSDYFFKQSDRFAAIVEETQQVFEKKETLLQKDLAELQRAITNPTGILQKYSNFSEFEKDLREDGFVLLAFKGDSLLFWSDNSFLIPDKEYLSLKKSQVVHIENGWYYIHKQQADSLDLYGFLLIKKTYPYQNQFLQNHFARGFSIPNSFSLSLEQGFGNSIFTSKGDFLFSLQPTGLDYNPGTNQKQTSIFYGLFILFSLIFSSIVLRKIEEKRLGLVSLFVWGIFLFLVRCAMLLWNIPGAFSDLELFSPVLFASSFFFPSLGDFALNSLFLFVFIYTYSRYTCRIKLANSMSRIPFFIWIAAHLALFLILYYQINQLFKSLIMDSSISFQMFVFQDDGFYVFVGFFILLLLFYSLGQLANLIVAVAKEKWAKQYYLSTIPLFLIASVAVGFLFNFTEFTLYDFVFLPLLFILLGLINYRKNKGGSYSLFVILLLLTSLFITNRINKYSEQKEKQNRLVAAMNLSTEYDPTSESLLMDLQKRIVRDSSLQKLCRRPFRHEMQIVGYIQEKYFTGYWEQYHVQITICSDKDDLRIEPDNQMQNCFDFFEQMIVENGEEIPNTSFYYLTEFDGMVSYLGVLPVASQRFSNVKIYLRLDSKIGNEGLGYPDLLLDEKVDLHPVGKQYSYGKYQNGKLITSSGKFNYFLNSRGFGEDQSNVYWRELDAYDHLIYKFGKNAVVVSCPSVTWYNRLITVPYVFVFLYVFGFFLWFLEHLHKKLHFNRSFKYRIQYSILGLLMLFFLLLGGGTVYYTINQANESNNRKLQEKLLLVKREVLENLKKDINRPEMLTERLRQLSNLIYADIHLYDLSGELIASSRPEIFKEKLQGKKINFAAYYQLFFKGRTHFIHKEKIGEMSYLSAYETLIDENNSTVAYVNLPYFLKSQELEKEMFNLILAGVNLHVFMILLAIFLSVLISNKITYPLRLIQDRLKATRFGSKSEQIEYSKNDEIGSLIKEYNQMLQELEASAERLARSERESAWREMARQIAHEIKNPLTPMKLSIQFLQKRFEERSENWEEHFMRVSKTLVDQINALSSIATAFSNFAKMPLAKNEQLNLVDVLQHVVSLFNNDNLHLQLKLNEIKNAAVYVDREQFVRVFVNLINNAIQSIPEGRAGKVCVQLKDAEKMYEVTVADNGSGIEKDVREKLFVPNFTTKSSGMGLGLAIVKNIIENANGKIWVESTPNKGSRFFISIPKHLKA